jgi:hypothetical protein
MAVAGRPWWHWPPRFSIVALAGKLLSRL